MLFFEIWPNWSIELTGFCEAIIVRNHVAGSLELAEDEGVHDLGHVLVDADDVQHARVAAVSGGRAVRRQVHDDQPVKAHLFIVVYYERCIFL